MMYFLLDNRLYGLGIKLIWVPHKTIEITLNGVMYLCIILTGVVGYM